MSKYFIPSSSKGFLELLINKIINDYDTAMPELHTQVKNTIDNELTEITDGEDNG